ncbi:MAG: serine/threonine protein kinase, partial [Pirellulaceae bacterium]|nr:serine/threonine protein kinase [Pirellulaceae bacterium]
MKSMKPFFTVFCSLALGSLATTAFSAYNFNAPILEQDQPTLSTLEESSHKETPDKSTQQIELDEQGDPVIKAGDWPQWGGTSYRNNVPVAVNVPIEWDPGSVDRRNDGKWNPEGSKNIKWVARLGSQSYGNPVVSNGKVYVGTNNAAGYLKRYPGMIDLGCLVCFDEKTGEFLWQHSSEKLSSGRVHDWPLQGICSAPLVEGNRLWFVGSRGEVICCDTNGHYDGKDDGEENTFSRLFDMVKDADPEAHTGAIAGLDEGKLTDKLVALFDKAGMPISGQPTVTKEENKWLFSTTVHDKERSFYLSSAGPKLSAFFLITTEDKHEADTVWTFNMMRELGVSQHNMASCSMTNWGDILFVNTSNGLDESHVNLPAPNAPSFIAMNKNTGEVYWTDKSPGANILHGQWSSPTVGLIEGEPQVIFAGGDGWVYSFAADEGKDGNPELLW